MIEIPFKETPNEMWYSQCSIHFEPHAKYKLIYSDSDAPLHTHMDFYELNLIIKGSYANHYNGEVKYYPQNTLLFWAPGQTHAIFKNEPNSIHCSFILPRDTFANICERYHPENPELISTPFAECILSPEKAAYLAGLSSKGLTQRADAEDFLQLFLHVAISHLFFENAGASEEKILDANECISDILLKFESIDYLLLPIAQLYAQYPICRASLIANFKKYTGHTIVEYRNMKRMEYSAMLLATQKFSVTQVASQVGITSFSYFSKRFKEYYGVLPSEYSFKHHKFSPTASFNTLKKGI